MSKQSLLRISGMIFLSFLTASVFAQTAAGNTSPVDKVTLEAFSGRLSSAIKFAEAAGKLAAINKKMAKNFTKGYSAAENIAISKGENNFTFVTCHVNGIRNRIAYDKKGYWHSTLRFYGEETLPRTIRHLVKSHYYDYKIAGITEVNYDGKLAHVVSLEGKSDWLKLKIVDGEMEVMESFKKS